MAYRWFRFGENAGELAGLPVQTKFSYYSSAILGMPRNLLCLIRPNLTGDLISTQKNFAEIEYSAVNPATRLGSLAVQLGFGYSPDFVSYKPGNIAQPADACVYSPATRSKYQFAGLPAASLQLFFARKIAALAWEHQTKLVFLHFPNVAELGSTAIPERECWPDMLGRDVALVGVPAKTLFAGLLDADVRKLFCNADHLNQNGQEYFTPVITPALLQIYDSETKH
jgi:hypothetical protein